MTSASQGAPNDIISSATSPSSTNTQPNSGRLDGNMHTPPPQLRLTLIAAVSPTNGLGKAGGLPWRLANEMAYFRRVTTRVPSSLARTARTARTSDTGGEIAGQGAVGPVNAVLMGRNTWNSIPPKFRPLKQRLNVVVSSLARPRAKAAPLKDANGAQMEREDEALDRAQRELGIDPKQGAHVFADLTSALRFLASRRDSLGRIFVIGGAQLYAQTLRELTLSAPPRRQTTTSSPKDGANPNAATTTDVDPNARDADVDEARRLARLDRLLITRIHAPSFDDCDAHLAEFRDARQRDEELRTSARYTRGHGGDDGVAVVAGVAGEDLDVETAPKWVRSTAEELRSWTGEGEEEEQNDVGAGVAGGPDPARPGPTGRAVVGEVQEERGVTYEFQMWTLRGDEGSEEQEGRQAFRSARV